MNADHQPIALSEPSLDITRKINEAAKKGQVTPSIIKGLMNALDWAMIGVQGVPIAYGHSNKVVEAIWFGARPSKYSEVPVLFARKSTYADTVLEGMWYAGCMGKEKMEELKIGNYEVGIESATVQAPTALKAIARAVIFTFGDEGGHTALKNYYA